MKYKYLILLGMIILSLNFITATLCRQETANASTASDGSCDLNYTGTYFFSGLWTNPMNVIDGNWNTYGTNSSNNVSFEVNYSKPINATTAIWSGCFNQSSNRYCSNISIPGQCWNAYSNKVVLNISTSPNRMTRYYCHNGTAWTTALTSNSGIWFMEEAIYWDIKCWTKTGNVLFIPNGCVYTGYNGESFLVG